MRYMLRKPLLMFFVFLLLAFLPKIAQTQTSSSEVRPFTDLSLEVSVPAQTLLPLQPIPITIKQINRTNQPVLGYKSLDFYSPIFIYVQKIGTNKQIQIEQLTVIHAFGAFKNSEISPGASYETKQWITLGLGKYFLQPGNYELQAVLENADGTQSIESNKVTIDIREPFGADRQVYNLIKNDALKDYLFSGAEFEKTTPVLETIKTRFPNSGYAKSAFYVLGEKHFVLKQYPQALVNLIKLEHDDDFIFAHKVRDYLSEIRRLPQGEQIQEKEQ